jgi:2,4-dienoyl-CoA reductase-like NADH-dependent reductase (Old Yellow Enzyme family)
MATRITPHLIQLTYEAAPNPFGVWKRYGTMCLVELKFTGTQADATDIDSFRAKIESKADNTMGVMVSISSYSSEAINEASGKKTPLLLLNASHIYLFLPDIMKKSEESGYMVDLAAAVKKQVSIPVITAGRISTGSLAESILEENKADLIGLARVLWADPEWPEKVKQGKEDDLVHCSPDCGDTCMKLVMKREPAFCAKWPHDKMKQ